MSASWVPVAVVKGKGGLSYIPLSAGSCPEYVGQLGACGCCGGKGRPIIHTIISRIMSPVCRPAGCLWLLWRERKAYHTYHYQQDHVPSMSASWVLWLLWRERKAYHTYHYQQDHVPSMSASWVPVAAVEGKEGLSYIPLSAGSCPQYVGQLGACGCCGGKGRPIIHTIISRIMSPVCRPAGCLWLLWREREAYHTYHYQQDHVPSMSASWVPVVVVEGKEGLSVQEACSRMGVGGALMHEDDHWLMD